MPQRIQDAARTRNETRQVQGLADNLDLRMGERGGAFACESLRIYGSARTCPTSWPIAASQPGISSSTFSSHSAGQLWWWSAILLRFNWIFFVGQKQQQTRQQQQQRQHDKHNKGQTAGVAGGQQDIRGCPPPFQESGNEGNNEMKFTNKRQPTIVFIAFCRCGCCECAAIVSFGFLAAVVSFCPAFCGSCCQTTPNNIIPAYCRRWLLIKTPSTCCSSSCSSRWSCSWNLMEI